MSEEFLVEIIKGDYSEKEIRLAFSKLSSKDLENVLDFLIFYQGRVSHRLRSLSRKWALSIEPEYLNDRLDSFIKHQESDDEDIRNITIELANNITEKVLIANIFSLIKYQESDDEDVRKLTSDLALKIDPNKLNDKLDEIIAIHEDSKNRYVIDLTTELESNILADVSDENVNKIIDMIIS